MDPILFKIKLSKIPIEELVQTLKIEVEIELQSIEARFQLSELYVKLNDYPKAINCFIEILQIDSDNEEAKIKKENITAIMELSQLDIYGSTNTYLDPWF